MNDEAVGPILQLNPSFINQILHDWTNVDALASAESSGFRRVFLHHGGPQNTAWLHCDPPQSQVVIVAAKYLVHLTCQGRVWKFRGIAHKISRSTSIHMH